MRVMVLVLLSAAACSGDDVELYPIHPGGGGGGGLTQADGGVDAPDMGGTTQGRVCVIDDARNFQACPSGAGGVTVKIGAATATTASDGSFTIDRPAGATLWQVSGTGFTSSAMALSSGSSIPLLTETVYTDMTDTNSAITGGGTGAILMKLRHNGNPVANAEGTPTPAPGGAVYYDATDASTWETDATGSNGVIWIPGLTAGTVSVAVTGTSNNKTYPDIQVLADTTTFVFATN